MRLTYIPADGFLRIDGVASFDTPPPACGCPTEFHALQVYEDGKVEVEWADSTKGHCLGNSFGCSGLPGGEKFLDVLVALHTKTLAAQETCDQ